jgi:hypothetical protein
MFRILGVDLPPTSFTLDSTFFFNFFCQLPLLNFFLFIMDLSKYTEYLSQWPAHVAPGLPTFGALFLLATGGLVIASKVWTFVRVLLSLFVLPGKPV